VQLLGHHRPVSFHVIPVLDAVKLIRRPVSEMHITNIHRRSDE
jgi:3-dehydroquinate dehydratase-2